MFLPGTGAVRTGTKIIIPYNPFLLQGKSRGMENQRENQSPFDTWVEKVST
jgi:hypothetical protein